MYETLDIYLCSIEINESFISFKRKKEKKTNCKKK